MFGLLVLETIYKSLNKLATDAPSVKKSNLLLFAGPDRSNDCLLVWQKECP